MPDRRAGDRNLAVVATRLDAIEARLHRLEHREADVNHAIQSVRDDFREDVARLHAQSLDRFQSVQTDLRALQGDLRILHAGMTTLLSAHDQLRGGAAALRLTRTVLYGTLAAIGITATIARDWIARIVAWITGASP